MVDIISEIEKQRETPIWGLNYKENKIENGRLIKVPGTGKMQLPSKFFEIEIRKSLSVLKSQDPSYILSKNKLVGEYYQTYDETTLFKILEKSWIEICKNASHTKTTPLNVKNGKVFVPEGTYFHSLSKFYLANTNLDEGKLLKDILYSISEKGILCSEFFGILESEREGCFCAFIDRTFSDNPEVIIKGPSKYVEETISVVFYFDDKNPLFKQLLDLDYFNYENKKSRGEDLSDYSPLVRKFFDNIIEPISCCPAAYNISGWAAIPFGVPPELIVGVKIIGDVEKFDQRVMPIDKLSDIFFNAVIFNGNYEVLGEREALLE